MRTAAAKACAGLEAERFVRDLGRDVCVDSSEALGAERGAEARVWRHRFRFVRDLLAPSAVLPIREDFWSLMGRRVRSFKLTAHQVQEGPSFKSELRRYRNEDPHDVARTWDGESAARLESNKQARRSQ